MPTDRSEWGPFVFVLASALAVAVVVELEAEGGGAKGRVDEDSVGEEGMVLSIERWMGG